ncbi:hypothetical protein H5410_046594 [Solanum commersonii]|uniref:At2g35280-like TPR domain-containing protein n=1 Tax=Solanum commersonii TaxID=4109 RepID=A0A9J5XGW9_SOLCO|nr:hypothetical protein H5410_046594 [Solanum commersonii]
MRVKLRVLNQVANEPSIYQKVTLVNFPYRRWSIVQEAISSLEMCRASGNLEALYRKGVCDFFNRRDSNGLGILSQAADGGHFGASYVLAVISIFNGGESMREGLMFIANMTPLKLRRCRENLRYTLYGRVPEPHLLRERPICCTVQSLHFRCELCRCYLEIDEENACNVFRWRDREDVDIRSRFVILRLANIIKELEINDENHIKRNDPYVATDDPYIAIYDTYVATDDPYVATYETYVTTFDQVLALSITSQTMYLLSI